MATREIIEIPTDSIKAQVLERTATDQGITDLANSIKQIGIIEPLIVLKTNTEFILQAGKRNRAPVAVSVPLRWSTLGPPPG